MKILSPVQDLTSLRAAIDAGADSVYFGVKGFNMRAGAKNFTANSLKHVVNTCHSAGVKAYLALNTIIYEGELKKVTSILKKAKAADIDAVICWDFSVLQECERLRIPIHLSTQASISNFQALKAVKQRFKMLRCVVLARECSLKDIKSIINKINKAHLGVMVEVFVHGAMCVSVSGRCLMSHHLFGKSANMGECLQPCRRSYIIKDAEEGHELELGTDYVMSPKDLCAMPFIEKLIEAGISIFKIEGRNRSPEYVKETTAAYREAVDLYKMHKLTESKKQELTDRLARVYNRGFSSGFFLGKPIAEWSASHGSAAKSRKEYIGFVRNFYRKPSVADVLAEARGFSKGDMLMFEGPTTGVKEQAANSIEVQHHTVSSVEKGKNAAVKTDFAVRRNDKVYKIVNITP